MSTMGKLTKDRNSLVTISEKPPSFLIKPKSSYKRCPKKHILQNELKGK